MSGLVATVLIPRPFEAADSSRVTSLLEDLFDEVEETRKGRHWDFSIERRAASLSVVSTLEKLPEYEDLFLSINSLPEDLPEAFEIEFGCSGEGDRVACQRLREILVREFQGIDCE